MLHLLSQLCPGAPGSRLRRGLAPRDKGASGLCRRALCGAGRPAAGGCSSREVKEAHVSWKMVRARRRLGSRQGALQQGQQRLLLRVVPRAETQQQQQQLLEEEWPAATQGSGPGADRAYHAIPNVNVVPHSEHQPASASKSAAKRRAADAPPASPRPKLGVTRPGRLTKSNQRRFPHTPDPAGAARRTLH